MYAIEVNVAKALVDTALTLTVPATATITTCAIVRANKLPDFKSPKESLIFVPNFGR